MDKENVSGFPILEPLARSRQDGTLGGLTFSSDATLDRFAFSVPDRIVEHLEKTSRVVGVDVSCMLLSAFASVLHRYTGGLLNERIRADAPQTFGDLARQFSNDPSYGFDGECFSKLFCVRDFPRDIGAPTIPECRILFVCDPWELESPQANVEGQHPSIAQCVVILREDRPGDKKLVAYYTQRGEQNPSVLELRESLGTKLPEYMVPAAYVKLDALPLTPSGKIDRRGLPLPDIKDAGVQDQYTPARNGIEEQVAQIWSEVLGIERIGIHDNFFALGGHSLLAVRLFSEINKRLGYELPLSILFQQGTIPQIAQLIDVSIEDQPIARIVQLSDGKDGYPLVVMPGLNGELLHSKELVDRVEHRSNVVGLQPNLDPRFLETFADFSRTATEYLRIIRALQPQESYRLLGYSYGGILGFEIARQLEEQGQAVDFCGLIDTGIEPDLSYRQLGSVAVHLARVSINLPRWIAASCGPNHFRKTVARANRKLRYFGRTLLAHGKTKYSFDDEFGTKNSQDDRRKVLGCLFGSFTDYKPKNYHGRVTLFRAATRPLYHHLSPDLGWSRIATHVDVHRVPGDHETILHTAPIERISPIIRESVEGLTSNDHA